MLVVGDLNFRVVAKGNELAVEELTNSSFSRRRSSLDVVTNNRGRTLLKYIDTEGMIILNGRSQDDSVGDFIFLNTSTFTSP